MSGSSSRLVVLVVTVLLVLVCFTADTPHAAQFISTAQPADFFPVGVWYSGGKARAPMLERIDATSEQRWSRDLDQIKSLGFNTVKTWVDWSTAEPQPGEYHFENLDLLLKLALDVNALPPTDDRWYEALRNERIAAAQQPA